MNLLDVARANEFVHTNSRSCGSSSHVNPLPTTRVSNGTLKMAILLEICKQRGTQLVIASQYGVSPMSISEADQLRIEYRNGMWTSFRATIAKLSNNSSKLVQLILLKAWNEHCRLPATSLLQQFNEKARQEKKDKATKLAADIQTTKEKMDKVTMLAVEKAQAADKLAAAINCAERAKKQDAKLAAYKLEAENTLAKLASYKRAEENERVAAANEAVDKLAAVTNCTERASLSKIDSQWEDMFKVLVRYIKETREMATRHMNDEQKAAWIWDGNVPARYKTPCGKALGAWINKQRTAKAKLKDNRELRLTSICLRWNMK
jgi:hypothetical protein